jgi:hypothetical protein
LLTKLLHRFEVVDPSSLKIVSPLHINLKQDIK